MKSKLKILSLLIRLWRANLKLSIFRRNLISMIQYSNNKKVKDKN